MIKRKFKITKVEVYNCSTSFDIIDLNHKNKKNLMSPQAFIHHIGALCGKKLEEIEGLEFEIILLEKKQKKIFDPLSLCGKTI